jgi:hypothetical protein
MSYCIYDVNGYVGDLASNKGLDDLWTFLEGKGKQIDLLIKDGTVNVSKELLKELAKLSATEASIAITLDNLRTLVKKCQDVVIVTDGTF